MIVFLLLLLFGFIIVLNLGSVKYNLWAPV